MCVCVCVCVGEEVEGGIVDSHMCAFRPPSSGVCLKGVLFELNNLILRRKTTLKEHLSLTIHCDVLVEVNS